MIIANRENFKVGVREWLYSLFVLGPLKYVCKKKRKDDLFRKGQKKIQTDLDLRTYINSIRHIKILQSVLLNERQRMLLPFQKRKVIDSGSSSESDDFHLETAVSIKDPKAPKYLKRHWQEQIVSMLTNYSKHNYPNQTDCALLYGIATKMPFTGISTIHRGADELIDYTTVDQFEREPPIRHEPDLQAAEESRRQLIESAKDKLVDFSATSDDNDTTPNQKPRRPTQ